MKKLALIRTGMLLSLLALPTPALAGPSSPEDQMRPEIVISIQGKGTSVGWDSGVIRAASERIPAIREQRLVLAANSGGAPLAAYLSCRGVTPQTLGEMSQWIAGWDRSLVNEHSALRKLWDAVVHGIDPRLPHQNLEPILAKILFDGACHPILPTLIVAANDEMISRSGTWANEKVFFEEDFSVRRGTRVLGKACTYFASRDLVDLLLAIPAEERLCDVRTMETAADVRVAVLASVSEPGFFAPFPEPAPEKIITGRCARARHCVRHYAGGFVMPGVAQDLRRAMPWVHVIGTGRPYNTIWVTLLVRSMTVVRIDRLTAVAKWWLDTEVEPDPETWDVMSRKAYSPQEEERLGYAAAHDCLRRDACRPYVSAPPRITWSPTDPSRRSLTTMRGLAEIMDAQGDRATIRMQ